MQTRLASYSFAILWWLTVSIGYSADSTSQLLAQLDNFEIIAVNQSQISDFGSQSAVTEFTEAVGASYTRQLLGLYIDGVEQPAIPVVFDGTGYLLPLVTILNRAGVIISDNSNSATEISLSTPGGEVNLVSSDLRLVDGQVMVLQSALVQKLLIDVRFDQPNYALYLVLPWSLAQSAQSGSGIQPIPDFVPPSASIRNLRADVSYVNSGNTEGLYGDYFAAGNLASGTWRFRLQQDLDGELTPVDYYWTREIVNSQVLIGNANYSLHPLLSTVENTGVQFLYSNKPLPRTGSADIRGNSSSRRMANGIRNIEGVALPGSVAELRIDGDVIARTRVRLDGTYDFPNVELPTRGYSEVVVFILDRGNGTLLTTQNFTRRSGIELLNAGQHSVFTAFGEQGNPLNDRYDSHGTTAAAQWRYGLTENLTLELGQQRTGNLDSTEASVSMAISSQWFGSLGYADSYDREAIQLDIEGGNNRWQLDFTTRDYNLTRPLKEDEQRRQWSRYLSYRYEMLDGLTLGVVGRDFNTSYEKERFVLPSASWSNRRNLSVSAYPNTQGNYRVDSRYRPTRRDTARYAFESDQHLFDYRHRNGLGQEYYANYRTGDDYPDRAEVGLIHYSDAALFGRTQFGIISNEGNIGYTLDWESRFLPGFNSRLRLSKGGYEFGNQDDEDDIFLQWQMTLDFAVANNRIVPADSTWGSLESAALTGEVLVGGERITADYGIDRIELIIDGETRTATVQGGRYYVDGLQPGLHKLTIDSRFLPIELMPGDNQSYWVRLDNAAATEVPLILEARYAIAGRVKNMDGENIINEKLIIVNENGRKVGEAYTDQYGLYRADNLAPGKYNVIFEREGERLAAIEVTITNEFLFEQDLIVP